MDKYLSPMSPLMGTTAPCHRGQVPELDVTIDGYLISSVSRARTGIDTRIHGIETESHQPPETQRTETVTFKYRMPHLSMTRRQEYNASMAMDGYLILSVSKARTGIDIRVYGIETESHQPRETQRTETVAFTYRMPHLGSMTRGQEYDSFMSPWTST